MDVGNGEADACGCPEIDQTLLATETAAVKTLTHIPFDYARYIEQSCGSVLGGDGPPLARRRNMELNSVCSTCMTHVSRCTCEAEAQLPVTLCMWCRKRQAEHAAPEDGDDDDPYRWTCLDAESQPVSCYSLLHFEDESLTVIQTRKGVIRDTPMDLRRVPPAPRDSHEGVVECTALRFLLEYCEYRDDDPDHAVEMLMLRFEMRHMSVRRGDGSDRWCTAAVWRRELRQALAGRFPVFRLVNTHRDGRDLFRIQRVKSFFPHVLREKSVCDVSTPIFDAIHIHQGWTKETRRINYLQMGKFCVPYHEENELGHDVATCYYGKSGTGKSGTMRDVLVQLLPDEEVSSFQTGQGAQQQFSGEQALCGDRVATHVLMNEVTQQLSMDVQELQKYIEHSVVTFFRKYKGTLKTKFTGTVSMCMNNWPRRFEEAMIRRLLIFRFNVGVPRSMRDNNTRKKLDIGGLLMKFLGTLLEFQNYHRQGRAQNIECHLPKQMLDWREKIARRRDLMWRIINAPNTENVRVVFHPKCYWPLDDFTRYKKNWVRDNGWDGENLNDPNELKEALAEHPGLSLVRARENDMRAAYEAYERDQEQDNEWSNNNNNNADAADVERWFVVGMSNRTLGFTDCQGFREQICGSPTTHCFLCAEDALTADHTHNGHLFCSRQCMNQFRHEEGDEQFDTLLKNRLRAAWDDVPDYEQKKAALCAWVQEILR